MHGGAGGGEAGVDGEGRAEGSAEGARRGNGFVPLVCHEIRPPRGAEGRGAKTADVQNSGPGPGVETLFFLELR